MSGQVDSRDGMTTKKRADGFSAQEKRFIKLMLSGKSVDKSLKEAGLSKAAMRRGHVLDEILSQYARLSLRWSGIVGKAKAALQQILDNPEEKGATKVQACKVVFWAVLNSCPGLLREEEEVGTRDEAADKVLGEVVPFEGSKVA